MNDQAQRTQLYELLGDLPPRDMRISAERVAYQESAKYSLETLVLHLNGIEPVPAYFVRPLGSTGPLPTVLYHHAHGGDYVLGKDELLNGRGALLKPTYAEALTAEGYAVLAIDHWLFGERRGRTELETFKGMLWQGQVLWGMIMYDALRAMDYLASREDVDSSRIATMGMSFGSTLAWWLAALDERVRVCVDLCCLTDFQALIDTRGLDGHGIYYYVPGLLKHFTTSSINALIAPRPHLSTAGIYDRLTPVAGLDKVDAAMRERYGSLGAEANWSLKRYTCGHMETAAMRQDILRFLRKHL